MVKRETPFLTDHYYHIYNRGVNREAIFFEDSNYTFFLRRWRKYLIPFTDVIAYCLMPTHYHFLVRVKPKAEGSQPTKTSEVFETSEVSVPEISRAMQKFSISYTKAMNKRYERVGALFQGAYQAKLINSEGYLLQLCCYIHTNPVKDGLVVGLMDWPNTNYLEWIGERGGSLFDRVFVKGHFSSPEVYSDFVNDCLQNRELPEDVRMFLFEDE